MAETERRFIIRTPYQSVGRPGTEVGASRLGMTDEQLDEWVDAGHATEVFRTKAAKPASKVTKASDGASDG